MDKIELTTFEKKVLEQKLKDAGYFTPSSEIIAIIDRINNDEEKETLDILYDKADKLCEELNANDEVDKTFDSSILLWYWMKYMEQNNIINKNYKIAKSKSEEYAKM